MRNRVSSSSISISSGESAYQKCSEQQSGKWSKRGEKRTLTNTTSQGFCYRSSVAISTKSNVLPLSQSPGWTGRKDGRDSSFLSASQSTAGTGTGEIRSRKSRKLKSSEDSREGEGEPRGNNSIESGFRPRVKRRSSSVDVTKKRDSCGLKGMDEFEDFLSTDSPEGANPFHSRMHGSPLPGGRGSVGSGGSGSNYSTSSRSQNKIRSNSVPRGGGSDNPMASPTYFDVDALENALRERGILRKIDHTFNLIAIPLLIISTMAIGFILVWAQDILVPFVIALFFTYLLKPMVNALSQPLGSCSEANCLNYFNPNACRRRMPGASSYASGFRQQRKGTMSDSSFDHVQVVFGDDDDPGDSSGSSNDPQSAKPGKIGEVELSEMEPAGSELRSRVPGAHRGTGYDRHLSGPSGSGSLRMVVDESVCFRCRHLRCPRWLAILLCMALVFSFFAGIVVLIVDAVQTFEDEDVEQFEEQMVDITLAFKQWMKLAFGIDLKSMLTQFRDEFHWVSITKSLVVSALNGFEYFFIVFLFVLYMLFESEEGQGYEPSLLSSSHSNARGLRKEIDQQIQRYLVIKTLISLGVGLAVYVVLGPILGVKMAHIFGVITFFANYVPNVGAMLATIVPIPVVILDPSINTLSTILAVALPVLIHSVVGNIVEPKVFGDTMELHPVVVLISLSFWYTVWGVPGAILSVPITAVMRIVLSNIEHPYATVVLCLLEGKLPGSRAFHDARYRRGQI